MADHTALLVVQPHLANWPHQFITHTTQFYIVLMGAAILDPRMVGGGGEYSAPGLVLPLSKNDYYSYQSGRDLERFVILLLVDDVYVSD